MWPVRESANTASNDPSCDLPYATGESEMKVLVVQLCPTLCDPMDRSLPGSSIHGTFQVRVLEWGAIASFFCAPIHKLSLPIILHMVICCFIALILLPMI